MPEKIPSTAARFKVGQQSAKATPATNLICGTMQMSSMNTARDAVDKGGEHGCPTGVDRATTHKSMTRYSSYIVRGGFRGFMYPDLIGYLLLGAGFAVTTTAGSGPTAGTYSHVFTLAARSALPWLSVESQIGTKNRQASDVRVDKLTLTANNQGFRYDGTYVGLTEGVVPGSGITIVNEDEAEILGSRGSMVLNYDPDGTPTAMIAGEEEGFSLVINNPLNTDQQKLFAFGRSDLPQNGVDVTGRVEGLYTDYNNYERINNGGVSNNAPSDKCAIAKLDTTFQSAELIASTAVPRSLRVELAHAEVTLDDFQAEGTNLIEWNFPYRMVDDNTTPIRITLVNSYPSYAA